MKVIPSGRLPGVVPVGLEHPVSSMSTNSDTDSFILTPHPFEDTDYSGANHTAVCVYHIGVECSKAMYDKMHLWSGDMKENITTMKEASWVDESVLP